MYVQNITMYVHNIQLCMKLDTNRILFYRVYIVYIYIETRILSNNPIIGSSAFDFLQYKILNKLHASFTAS